MTLFVIRKLTLEIVVDLFRTPLWWYQDGLQKMFHWWAYMMRRGNARLGVKLWIRNIFAPMFGQRDWQGRLVSFFMRVVNIIGRGIAYVAWILFITAVLLLWFVAPFLLLMGLILSLAG